MAASTQVSTYCLFANAVMGFGQQQLSASFSVGAALTVSTQLFFFPKIVKALGDHATCSMGMLGKALLADLATCSISCHLRYGYLSLSLSPSRSLALSALIMHKCIHRNSNGAHWLRDADAPALS
ncbi:MAG: hypothetical protein ACPIOQ_11195, partial [Promethearchaeia archaeon]